VRARLPALKRFVLVQLALESNVSLQPATIDAIAARQSKLSYASYKEIRSVQLGAARRDPQNQSRRAV